MAGEKGKLRIVSNWRYRVFVSEGFRGNPTTVHELEASAHASSLLHHSRSLDTIDNVYFHASADPGCYHVHTVSHSGEIRICGHALLATAYHLLQHSGRDHLILQTAAYRHHCRRQGHSILIEMPACPYQEQPEPLLEQLLEQAGVTTQRLLMGPWGVWIAIAKSAAAIAAFAPERFPWQALDSLAPGALVLSARLPDGYALRYFAPWFGKPEDSATGSAQCYLAPYWLRSGQLALAHQLSPEGSAMMHVSLAGGQVWLSGQVECDEAQVT